MLPLFFISFLFVSPTISSLGDASAGYKACLSDCMTSCSSTPPPPSPLFWSCSSDCAYQCTQNLTSLTLTWSQHPRAGEVVIQEEHPLEGLLLGQMTQFYGKWPIKRWWFIQEPMSALGSFGNLWAHYTAWRWLSRKIPKSETVRKLRIRYLGFSFIGFNTWIWSIVFHTRDLPWTEKLDYYSAGLGTTYAFYICVYRVFSLFSPSRRKVSIIWSAACGLMFLTHISYLSSRDRFDYGYNMKYNISLALIVFLLYAIFISFHYLVSRSPPKKLSSNVTEFQSPPPPSPLLPLLALSLATSLEVLDFPPMPSDLRLLDAHALWHFSTIPIVSWWAKYLKDDLDWEFRWGGGNDEREAERSLINVKVERIGKGRD
jgi:post-GPI attachment to proteins factor 3